MFASCSKNSSNSDGNPNGASKVQFVLTDAPAPYDAVNINIKEINIIMNGKSGDSVVNYPLAPQLTGPVNLLTLKNGGSMYMGDPFSLPAGSISQIRLVLGDGNTIVTGGVTHDLTTPSAQESGLKINFHQTLEPNGIYKIWLDFDVARSIVKAGNSGKYLLKPVIRANTEAATFGAIRGTVLPSVAGTTVYLLNGADTIGSTLPEKAGSTFGEGYYKFINLAPGTYSLSFNATDSTKYMDSTVNNIAVTSGTVTNVTTVTLHQ
ncbi:carbohydrate-binding protein [Niabella soli DSM 19437]|uniref:Carbohydrate-binding protein n=1 Tax=Niabella soli DSM 19437 TaxID=929713 RepID=W0EXN7_9BACT|nr:carbohydrate-binding protein [Niabella soli DSM 19437]